MSRISVVSSYAIRNPKSAERKDVSYAYFIQINAQLAFTCSKNDENNGAMREICPKLIINTPDVNDVVLFHFMLTWNIFHKLFWCFQVTLNK